MGCRILLYSTQLPKYLYSDQISILLNTVPFDDFLKFPISDLHIVVLVIPANWTILQLWVTIFTNNMPI